MRWFTSSDGRVVLGPYEAGEIGPQLTAQKWLGYPKSTVYAVEAGSALGAQAKVQSMLRQTKKIDP
jgi:hypothetical protein